MKKFVISLLFHLLVHFLAQWIYSVVMEPKLDRILFECDKVNIESVKKVTTFDADKKENGFLIELDKDGRFTKSYMSCCGPGAFKGYHWHRVRAANYVCIRGSLKVILYTKYGREEHLLSADNPQRLHIPARIPTGLLNEGKEEAWIVNYPKPYYDPLLKDEQVDFTQEELDLARDKQLLHLIVEW